jgi:hypothetical protein
VGKKIQNQNMKDPHKDRQREGDFKPSFASSLIERQEEHRLSNHESAWLAGTML